MIVTYDINTGDVLGYAIVGGTLSDNSIEWDGITPEPIQNFRVINDEVVEKSNDAQQAILDNQQLRSVRGERDKLLLASDYTQVADVPTTAYPGTKAEWQTYRQELRDITDQDDIYNIIWPNTPE